MLFLAKIHIVLLYPREHLEITLLLVIIFLRSCGIVNPQGILEPSEVLFFFFSLQGGGVRVTVLFNNRLKSPQQDYKVKKQHTISQK